MPRNNDSPLFALPLAGGNERKVIDCVAFYGFTVGLAGVYHLACGADPRSVPLSLLDPATGRDRLLGNLENAAAVGLTVSPDGKTILYEKMIGEGVDLMMIENFRQGRSRPVRVPTVLMASAAADGLRGRPSVTDRASLRRSPAGGRGPRAERLRAPPSRRR